MTQHELIKILAKLANSTPRRKQVPKNSPKDQKHYARKLRKCYTTYDGKSTRFPEWALKIYEKDSQLFKEAVVYYDRGDNRKVVERLATERELVNIAMGKHERGYNLKCFQSLTNKIMGKNGTKVIMVDIMMIIMK